MTTHQINGSFRATGFIPSYTANLRRHQWATQSAIDRIAGELAALPDTAAARTTRATLSIKQTALIGKMRRLNYALSQTASSAEKAA